jgi:hypothetical protein
VLDVRQFFKRVELFLDVSCGSRRNPISALYVVTSSARASILSVFKLGRCSPKARNCAVEKEKKKAVEK